MTLEERKKTSNSKFGEIAKRAAEQNRLKRIAIHPMLEKQGLWRRFVFFSRLVKNPEFVLEAMESVVCHACGRPEKALTNSGKRDFIKGLSLDHDHQTLILRGALCTGCNIALGQVEDDPERLEKLIAYLRKPRTHAGWVRNYLPLDAKRTKDQGSENLPGLGEDQEG